MSCWFSIGVLYSQEYPVIKKYFLLSERKIAERMARIFIKRGFTVKISFWLKGYTKESGIYFRHFLETLEEN